MQMIIGLIFASFHNTIIDKWDRPISLDSMKVIR